MRRSGPQRFLRHNRVTATSFVLVATVAVMVVYTKLHYPWSKTLCGSEGRLVWEEKPRERLQDIAFSCGSDALGVLFFDSFTPERVSGSQFALVDLTTGAAEPTRLDPLEDCWSLRMSNDGTLMVGTDDFTFQCLRLPEGRCVATLRHTPALKASTCALSPSGENLVVSYDQTLPDGTTAGSVIEIWDTAKWEKLEGFTVGAGLDTGRMVISRDSRWLAWTTHSPSIGLYEIGSGRKPRTLLGHTAITTAVAFSPDGTRLMSGDIGSEVIVWDMSSTKRLLSLSPVRAGDANFPSQAMSIGVSPDSRIVAVARNSSHLSAYQFLLTRGNVRLLQNEISFYDIRSGVHLASVAVPNWVDDMLFSSSGDAFVASVNNCVLMWPFSSEKLLEEAE